MPQWPNPSIFDPNFDLYVDNCRSTIQSAGDPPALDAWDVAVAPESDVAISGCRIIHRSRLVTAASRADLDPAGELSGDGCDPRQLDGIDAVWGMRWAVTANTDYAGRGVVREHALQYRSPPTASPVALSSVKRSTSPSGAARREHRDVAYHARELRIDWSGDLRKEDWQRGTRCADYVVSDADVFVVGAQGERWYEQARGFTKIELRIGGTLIETKTTPSGQFCVNLDIAKPSGRYALELKAYVDGGARTVTAVNPRLSIDHDPPSGYLIAPPDYVEGPIHVEGVASDAHSGMASWRLEAATGTGAWRGICTVTQPTPGSDTYGCEWDTTDGQWPDGTYRLRAVMRDRLGTERATAEAGGVIVNNAGDTEDVVDDPYGVSDPGEPETASEPPIPATDPPDDVGQEDSGEAANMECDSSGDFLEEVTPTYEAPLVEGVPSGTATPEESLVAFFVSPHVTPVPLPLFEEESRTADTARFSVIEDGARRALVVLMNEAQHGWSVEVYLACTSLSAKYAIG